MVRPAGNGSKHHRYGEVKTRLTIDAWGLSSPQLRKKKGAPACAGAPRRSGHCRVCAQTVVVGATPEGIAPREDSHIVGAFGMLGDVEAFAFALDIGTQADDDVDDLVED